MHEMYVALQEMYIECTIWQLVRATTIKHNQLPLNDLQSQHDSVARLLL